MELQKTSCLELSEKIQGIRVHGEEREMALSKIL